MFEWETNILIVVTFMIDYNGKSNSELDGKLSSNDLFLF